MHSTHDTKTTPSSTPVTVNEPFKFEGAGRFDCLAIGSACIIELRHRKVSEETVESSKIQGEIERVRLAFRVVADRYQALTSVNTATSIAAEGNFDGLSMARSDSLRESVVDHLVNGSFSAAYAIHSYFDSRAEALDLLPDRQRELHHLRLDLLDVVEPLQDGGLDCFLDQIPSGNDPLILVAETLSPQELLQLHGTRISGVILKSIGKISHVALAFPHILPAVPLVVAGDTESFTKIKRGDSVIVDGRTGWVSVNPSQEEVTAVITEIETIREKVVPVPLREHAPKTADGLSIRFTADVFTNVDAADVDRMDLGGVGLYRAEVPIIQARRWLTEDEWHKHFCSLFGIVSPRPVVVRVFDFNDDDKRPPGSDKDRAVSSGLSGIRLALNIFRPQLTDMVRGLARASMQMGNRASLLLPMVLDLNEIRDTTKLVKSVVRSIPVPGGGHPHESLISLSAMVETSAAFRLIDAILKRVDSINIGTNDSLKSVLGGDRNKSTSAFYHPAFLKELRDGIAAARRAGKTVRVCGDMPNHPQNIPLLVGLGAEDLVVAPHAVDKLNAMLLRCHSGMCAEEVERIINSGDEKVALRLHQALVKKLSLP